MPQARLLARTQFPSYFSFSSNMSVTSRRNWAFSSSSRLMVSAGVASLGARRLAAPAVNQTFRGPDHLLPAMERHDAHAERFRNLALGLAFGREFADLRQLG